MVSFYTLNINKLIELQYIMQKCDISHCNNVTFYLKINNMKQNLTFQICNMSKSMIINSNNIIFHLKTYLVILNFYINSKLITIIKIYEVPLMAYNIIFLLKIYLIIFYI